MNKLISILLPTYNGQRFIRKMLDSIYQQDYRPIELIVSDDASTDQTVSIINNWMGLICRYEFSVKFLRNKKNKGLSKNISNLTQFVHGKYLFLADQDDIWIKDKISKQVQYLEDNRDCAMCICDRNIIDANDKIVCPSIFQYIHADLGKRDYKKVMNTAILYPSNCMCLRAENLNDIFQIPEEIYSHDTFIAIMAVHYGKIGYIKNVLTEYRVHGNNLSGQYALETNRNLLKAGYMTYKGMKRKKHIGLNDTIIINQELAKRFHEESNKFPRKLWGDKVRNALVDTILYIVKNMEKWKKFCG